MLRLRGKPRRYAQHERKMNFLLGDRPFALSSPHSGRYRRVGIVQLRFLGLFQFDLIRTTVLASVLASTYTTCTVCKSLAVAIKLLTHSISRSIVYLCKGGSHPPYELLYFLIKNRISNSYAPPFIGIKG